MDKTQILFKTSNFWIDNWYYIITLAVSAAGIFIAYMNLRKKPSPSAENGNFSGNSVHSSSESNPTIPINITNNINTQSENTTKTSNDKTILSDEKLKATVKILFVDDNHTEYKMVSILKKAGWTKTKSVKDIKDLDTQLVIDSDIIFVDINGVGLLFEDQGLGLASALKVKYPKKKIIIYSAETSGDRFHKALRQVDDCLPKNAEPYQFINMVENLSKLL